MINTGTETKRTLINFHLRELDSNPKLLAAVVDDYIGFYWETLEDAGADVIQDKLLEHTQQTIQMPYIKKRKELIARYSKMERRNEKFRLSHVR
jgi:hypothetical protein